MSQKNVQSMVREAMSKVPTDLPLLMRAYGLGYDEDVLRGPSALIVPRERTQQVKIEINSMDPPAFKRISVAYEIARWVLAKDKLLSQSEGRRTPGAPSKPVRHDTANPEDRGATDPSTGIETKRISWLASEILLPKDNLKRILSTNGNDLNAAAEMFGVSREAVMHKARKHKMV